MPKGRTLAILCGVVLLGSLLLLYQLDAKSLWVDEIFSVDIASKPDVVSVVDGVAREERRPPLYHLALHLWITGFGTADFPLRLFSVILGVFALLVVFKLGSLLRGDDLGLLATYMLAISPTFVDTPQVAMLLDDPEFKAAIVNRIPLRRVGTPDDLIGAVLFFCSPASSFVTGQILTIDGGLTATQ